MPIPAHERVVVSKTRETADTEIMPRRAAAEIMRPRDTKDGQEEEIALRRATDTAATSYADIGGLSI